MTKERIKNAEEYIKDHKVNYERRFDLEAAFSAIKY